jgi:3-deoxy-D-manno-octulosonic-acid transferase
MTTQRIWQLVYSWIVFPVAWLVVHLLALKNQNIKDALEGQKGLWQRLETQLRQRDMKKSLIWFHVSSAGEFLQAQPVFERCMQQGFECALTFTSVNGYKWIQRAKFLPGQHPVVTEYLPLDTVGNMRRLLKILQPSVIVYVKYDLWPSLIWEAHKAGIPQYLISATLQPRSKRLTSAIGRSVYRALYACLHGIFAVTEEDRQRFLTTNPDHPNIQTLGDTRLDSVLDRKKRVPLPKIPAYIQEKFVFIAGSSWPPDEACIFPALKEALEQYPDFLAIIVPHEPNEEHLQNSETFFKDFLLERLTQLNQNPTQPPRIILGDTVGILSSLYSVGTLAYVGGAFTTGVHNIMEPCAMGLPVIFGPKHYNSPEAVDLLKRELVFTVKNEHEFRTLLFRFLNEPERCTQLGQQCTQMIEAQAGGADRCFQLITQNTI